MKQKTNMMKLGMVLAFFGGVCCLTVAAQKPKVETRPPVSPPQSNAVAVETLPRVQFRALAVNAQVLYKGQKMTKADFMHVIAKEWGASKAKVTVRSLSANPPVNLESIKAEHVHKQATDLAAQKAKSQADFANMQQDEARLRQSPQYAALTKEATDLVNRYGAASPAEKARIKQRAGEVYKQLVQMEGTGVSH